MSNKTKAVFIILAGLALVAIGLLASIILVQRNQQEQSVSEQQGDVVKTDVVVVTRDLFLGDVLTSTDLATVSVPVELAPRDMVTDVEEAVGKIIKTDLVQGEMLLMHNLADPTNNINDLSFVLGENHVLMAFPADDLMSINNMVQRGDIVDILATFEEEVQVVGEEAVTTTGEAQEPKMRTFTVDTFQRVQVTALVLEVIPQENNTDTTPQTQIKAYLLALDPQDALVLKHLKDSDAVFDIVLRNPTSTNEFTLTPVTDEYIVELYGLEILP